MAVEVEAVAVSEEAPLALLDFRRVVVALLHGLQRLLLAERELVVLETRRGEHFAQDGEALVEVLREQVQAHAALRVASGGGEAGSEEG